MQPLNILFCTFHEPFTFFKVLLGFAQGMSTPTKEISKSHLFNYKAESLSSLKMKKEKQRKNTNITQIKKNTTQ